MRGPQQIVDMPEPVDRCGQQLLRVVPLGTGALDSPTQPASAGQPSHQHQQPTGADLVRAVAVGG